MNSEERVVRPYRGVDRIQQALGGFSLSVGSEILADGTRTTLPSNEYLTCPVSLVFAGDGAPITEVRKELSDGSKELEIDPSDLELLAIVSTPRLKLSKIVWQLTLDRIEELPAQLSLANAEERPAALQTPFGGSRIELFLVLARQLEPVVLRPWRKGTWLGRVAFFVVSDVGEIGFTPIPLNDALRDQLQVPATTNRVVRIDSSVLDPEVDEEALELYVDEHLLAQLAHFPNHPGSRAFQRQLFLDAATAIVMDAIRDGLEHATISEIEHSLLGRLVEVAAGRITGESALVRRSRQEQVLDSVRSQPSTFVARLEAAVDTKADLSEAMAGVAP